VRWGPLIEAELGDAAALADAMTQHRVSAVMHFAAFAYVGESVGAPMPYFHNNVSDSLVLLDAMLQAKVPHIVFSSSCATYGLPESLPITETQPQRPVNPYGEAKLIIERALHWYAAAYGLTPAVLRYFNAAGADPDGEIGENHDPETHLIPLVIDAALGRRAAVDVCGTDYPTPDGTAIRDYIHVRDLAEAHVLALDHLLSGGEGLTLNLGTGQGHSVREVIEATGRIIGQPVPYRDVARRAGDPPVLIADPRLAAAGLGWPPRLSALDSIIETASAWRRRRPAPAAAAPARASLATA
jgi:UDP-glucose-4-epimerase GalE